MVRLLSAPLFPECPPRKEVTAHLLGVGVLLHLLEGGASTYIDLELCVRNLSAVFLLICVFSHFFASV